MRKFIPGKPAKAAESEGYSMFRVIKIGGRTGREGQKPVIPGKALAAYWKQRGYGGRVTE